MGTRKLYEAALFVSTAQPTFAQPSRTTTVSTVHYEALIAKREAYAALQAENERLKAMIADALAIEAKDADPETTFYAASNAGWNAARDEFREKLGVK